jgi:type IV pilus assembly protein PilW
MKRFQIARPARGHGARGVTLVELLVGMTIGLLSVVIITQVMAVSEEQKRTTSSGSDAQVNGALALSSLQREIRMAGYGLAGAGFATGCQIAGKFNGVDISPASSWMLAPIQITQGDDGAPDSIRVMRSNSRDFALPLLVAEEHKKSDTAFVMRNVMTSAARAGDLMLVVPPDVKASWCTLFAVNPAPADRKIEHLAGTGGAWNSAPDQSAFPDKYPAGSVIVNTGSFVNDLYSVVDNQLRRTSFVSATNTFTDPEPMFSQIVDLQAVYGKGPAGIVTTWDEAQPVTAEEWRSVLAVRIGLVSRSAQFEKDEVTNAAPTWTFDGKTTQAFAVDKRDADWKHYRYKVYEAVVPLRNVIWQSKLD